MREEPPLTTRARGQPISWIVGASFLKNVYSVFRYEPFAIGFAQLADTAQTVSNGSVATGATTGGGTTGSGGSSGSGSGSGTEASGAGRGVVLSAAVVVASVGSVIVGLL